MSTITTRSGKGSSLTNAEIDANFSNLNNDKLETSAYTAADVLAKLLTVDGAASGLDADLLDGQSSAYYTDIVSRLGYTPLNAASYTAADVLAKLLTVDGHLSNLDADTVDGVQLTGLVQTSRNITTGVGSGLTGGGNLGTDRSLAFDTTWGDARYLLATAYTANDILTKIKTVDGTGSGLDADLLDGNDSAYYTAIASRLGYTPANAATTLTAGTGLTGGVQDLSANRSIAFDTTWGDSRYAASGHNHNATYLQLVGGDLTGTLRVKNGAVGYVALTSGDASYPGYIDFYTPAGVRAGYIGYGNVSNQLLLQNANGWTWKIAGAVAFDTTPNVSGTNVALANHNHSGTYMPVSGGIFTGDITTHRGDNTGVLYLGNLQNHYLYYNGSTYILANAGLDVGGTLTCGYLQASGNLQSGGHIHTANGAYYVYSYQNVYAQGDIIAYYSDERLKKKLGNISNALEKVCSLDGFLYQLNDIGQVLMHREDDTEIHAGVGAHQVKAVLPQAVALAPFDMDQEHGGSKSGSNYLTVKYERLVPLLIEAIKELNAKVERYGAA